MYYYFMSKLVTFCFHVYLLFCFVCFPSAVDSVVFCCHGDSWAGITATNWQAKVEGCTGPYGVTLNARTVWLLRAGLCFKHVCAKSDQGHSSKQQLLRPTFYCSWHTHICAHANCNRQWPEDLLLTALQHCKRQESYRTNTLHGRELEAQENAVSQVYRLFTEHSASSSR